MLELWPSKKQWKKWSLPSKLAAIGVYVGIPLTILLFFLNFISQPNLNDIVRAVADEYETKLDEQYPVAHVVFGVYQNRNIIPSGLMPKNLEIDWSTGKVQSLNDNVLLVTLPNMVLNGKTFIGGNVTQVERRIGAKSGSIIKLGWFNPIVEVIGIDGELVVVALGFPANSSKDL